MASMQKDWEDLNISRDEVNNLMKALKNDEFRKLLVEYAEETQSAESRKKYQEEIVQLEAERGIDCTFVNPTPGFVIKTSSDGVSKTFINVCSNSIIGKPKCEVNTIDGARKLAWSIPHSLTPARDDYDKKKARCVVYDVVFHVDALYMCKSGKFQKMLIDTAFQSIEDAYKVELDKQNFKLPKLKYKGIPNASVIRKKSSNQVVLSEDEIEFHKKLNMPPLPTSNSTPAVISTECNVAPNYTTPHYVIKYRNDIDVGDFTDDRFSKFNSAIPKELVIEINLPLLSTATDANLDISEKSLELISEKPAKYKLNLHLPYAVSENGAAKFDTDKRLLIITLPVIRQDISTKTADFHREDSGVESDLGDAPVNESEGSDIQQPLGLIENVGDSFLDPNMYYVFPGFDINRESNSICFILDVKNIDATSVKHLQNDSSFHIKFTSMGSGCFPVSYSFCAFLSTGITEDIQVEVWNNNITIQVQCPMLKDDDIVKVGPNFDDLLERHVDEIIDLTNDMNMITMGDTKDGINDVTILSANVDEVVFEVDLEDGAEHQSESDNYDDEERGAKLRTYSEGSSDESNGLRKSILKRRMNRSLSESCADDGRVPFSEGVQYTLSDSCIPEGDEEDGGKGVKKTVRFSDNIQRQLFRVNSSILGQRRKNQKRTKNKRRALERRASESETSESEERGTSGKIGDENIYLKKGNNLSQNTAQDNSEKPGSAVQEASKKQKKNKKLKNPKFQNDFMNRLND